MADQGRKNPLKEEREVLGEYRQRKDAQRNRTGSNRVADRKNRVPEPDSALDIEIRKLAKETNLGQTGEPPYFGRLDFHDGFDGQRYTVYLGTAFDDLNIEVVDWRRPLARLYFPPQPSDVSVNGTTMSNCGRRELFYKGREIDSLLDSIDRRMAVQFDDVSTPWDGPVVNTPVPSVPARETGTTVSRAFDPTRDFLVRRLMQRSAGREFVPFVESMVEEQFSIISEVSENRVLVIHGPAGSGKTGCALMRAATLHYRRRNHAEFDLMRDESKGPLKVVLISKTDELLEYVDGVLPALGEDRPDRIAMRQLSAMATQFILKNGCPRAESSNESANVRSLRAHDIRMAAKSIRSCRIILLGDQLVRMKTGHVVLGVSQSIVDSGTVVQRSQNSFSQTGAAPFQIEEDWDREFREKQHQPRTNLTEGGFFDRIRSVFGQRPYDAEPVVQPKVLQPLVDTNDWIGELVHSRNPEKSFTERINILRKKWTLPDSSNRGAFDRGSRDNTLRPDSWNAVENVLRAWFESVRNEFSQVWQLDWWELARTAAIQETDAGRRTVLNMIAKALKSGCDLDDPYSVAIWFSIATCIVEDAPVRFSDINHIVIDEAQEFSTEEFLLIDCAFGSECRLTVCGDLYQRSNPDGITNWRQLERLFAGGFELKELETNYRSSRQINSVARAILAATESRPSPRLGPPVQLHRVEGMNRAETTQYLAKLIEMMERDKVGRTGVLWTAQQPPFQKFSLTKLVSMEVARKERGKSDLIGGRVDELGGLEYDAAILVVGEMSDDKETRRSLYVAITRARTHLHIVCTRGTPSWFIELMPKLVKVVNP